MIFQKYKVLKIIPNYYTEDDNDGFPSNVGKIKDITLIIDGYFKSNSMKEVIVAKAVYQERI